MLVASTIASLMESSPLATANPPPQAESPECPVSASYIENAAQRPDVVIKMADVVMLHLKECLT